MRARKEKSPDEDDESDKYHYSQCRKVDGTTGHNILGLHIRNSDFCTVQSIIVQVTDDPIDYVFFVRPLSKKLRKEIIHVIRLVLSQHAF